MLRSQPRHRVRSLGQDECRRKVNPALHRLVPLTLRARRPGKSYLDLNEPMMEATEQRTLDAMSAKGSEVLRRSLNQYPLDSVLDLALRERVSEYCKCGGPENVLITRGSDAGLKIAFDAFAFQGTVVGALYPTYESIFDKLETSGTCPKDVTLIPCEKADEFPDALCEGPRYDVLYLCNPNNPLGYVIGRDVLLREIDARPETLFVVDEAYVEYANDVTSVVAAAVSRPNLIVARTFSKAFGMPGARLGFMVAAPEILEVLRKLVCPTEVPDTSKAIGLTCLHPEHIAVFRVYFERTRSLRTWVMTTLTLHLNGNVDAASKGYVGVLQGAAGMFVTFEVSDADVASRLVKYLDDVWDILVAAPKSYVDRTSTERHLVRCQIGDSTVTPRLVTGICEFFSTYSGHN